MAIVFPREETGEGGRGPPVLFRPVLAYNLLEEFHSTGTFYGDLLPGVLSFRLTLKG